MRHSHLATSLPETICRFDVCVCNSSDYHDPCSSHLQPKARAPYEADLLVRIQAAGVTVLKELSRSILPIDNVRGVLRGVTGTKVSPETHDPIFISTVYIYTNRNRVSQQIGFVLVSEKSGSGGGEARGKMHTKTISLFNVQLSQQPNSSKRGKIEHFC